MTPTPEQLAALKQLEAANATAGKSDSQNYSLVLAISKKTFLVGQGLTTVGIVGSVIDYELYSDDITPLTGMSAFAVITGSVVMLMLAFKTITEK